MHLAESWHADVLFFSSLLFFQRSSFFARRNWKYQSIGNISLPMIGYVGGVWECRTACFCSLGRPAQHTGIHMTDDDLGSSDDLFPALVRMHNLVAGPGNESSDRLGRSWPCTMHEAVHL